LEGKNLYGLNPCQHLSFLYVRTFEILSRDMHDRESLARDLKGDPATTASQICDNIYDQNGTYCWINLIVRSP
jgi:hypothetical protein